MDSDSVKTNDWIELDNTPGKDTASADELRAALADASKLWLAHDGLWFLEWEKRHGMEEAMDADAAAWERLAALEAKRIMRRLGLKPGGGIDAMVKVLPHRLYANICRFTMHRRGENELRLRMVDCRVQDARNRQNMPPFPCKSVAMYEYPVFARVIDPRIETECLQCPPDQPSEGGWCEWLFRIS